MTREEAIQIINCYDIGFYDLSGEKIPADKLADAFYMAIEALSAEDDRSTGEWVDGDGNNVPLHKDGYPLRSCYCNQCHEWLVGSDEYYTKGNFCPNCGAKMNKGGDDE